MKLARTGIIAAAAILSATVAFAQAPDFSGSWTVDASAAPAPPAGGAAGGGGRAGGGGGRGGMMGGPMVVKQTKDAITVETTRGETKTVATYKLDGTESVNKMMRGRGDTATEIETKSTAKWDGAKLVISTQMPGQDGAMVSQTQTWSLDGGVLTIERPRPDGTSNKVAYKKTT